MTNSVFVATSFAVALIEDIEDDMWDCEGFASPLMFASSNLISAVAGIVAKEMDEIADMHDPDDGNPPAPHELTTRLEASTPVSWVYRMDLRGEFYGTIKVRLLTID